MTARGLIATALALLGACTSPRSAPPAAASWPLVHVPLPEETRLRLEADVEGTWVSQLISGDTVTVITTLEAKGGSLREKRRVAQVGGALDPAPEPVRAGRYTIDPEGALDIVLDGPEPSHRRSFFTVLPTSHGVTLVTQLARGDGKVFRYSVAEERTVRDAPKFTSRIELTWSFTSPLSDVVGKSAPCAVEMRVMSSVLSRETAGQARWKCHVGATRGKLRPVVLDGPAYQTTGDAATRDLVDHAVNAPLWFDPSTPALLFMSPLDFDDVPYGWPADRPQSKSP